MSEHSEIHLRPTSRRTAYADDLVLREGERSRLVFRPMLVANPADTSACVRGEFRYQKKSVSDTWENCHTRSLNELRIGDGGFKLELHASEVKELRSGLDRFCALFGQEGIPREPETYTFAPGHLGYLVRSLLDRREDFDSLGEDGAQLLTLMINLLTREEDTSKVARVLSAVEESSILRLTAAVQVGQLENLLILWQSNLDCADESWWQQQFELNAWVLPQIFGQPFVLLNNQAFMGGKRIDNTGGHVLDLLFRNALTNNVALVEIKTPQTRLLGSRVRDGIWSFSSDLSAGVTQMLSYRDDLQKEYYGTHHRSVQASGETYQVFNPRCVLLAGNIGAEMSTDAEKMRCLDLARNDFRCVDIVTYDEMLLRLNLLLSVLTNSTCQSEGEQSDNDFDDIHF